MMKNRSERWRTIVVAIAVVMMGTAGVQARSPLRIAAEVTRPENNLLPVTVTVTDAAGDTVWTRTSRRAFNRLELPEHGAYTVSFSQPYCITKQVLINNTQGDHRSATRSRKLRFEVILEPDPNGELVYAGPVGRIEVNSAGVRVATDRNLVPVNGTGH